MLDEEEAQRKKNADAKGRPGSSPLTVSNPENASEKEADAVAQKVASGQRLDFSTPVTSTFAIQAKGQEDLLPSADPIRSSLSTSKGSGRPLDDSAKMEMETTMGTDFSNVRIHTGANAHTMSESINARAFTHGQDIYFRDGHYNTQSKEGKELLAHELVHTKQEAGSDNAIHRKPDDKSPDRGASAGANGSFNTKTGGYSVADENDNLNAIAKRFNTTVYELRKLNNLIPTDSDDFAKNNANYKLKSGQVLKIPSSATYAGNVSKTLNAPADLVGKLKDLNYDWGATTGVHYAAPYKENVEDYKNDPVKNANLKPYADNWQSQFDYGYANENYWQLTTDKIYYFRIKPGVKASEALKAWFNGLTIADCASAVIAIYYDNLRQALGDERFDEVFSDMPPYNASPDSKAPLVISQYTSETYFKQFVFDANKERKLGAENDRPVKIGDWCYFNNHPAYKLKHPGGNFKGENAVYEGRKTYWDPDLKKDVSMQLWSGFGVSHATEKELRADMAEAYNFERNEDDYRRIIMDILPALPKKVQNEINTSKSSYKDIYNDHLDYIPKFLQEGQHFFPSSILPEDILNAEPITSDKYPISILATLKVIDERARAIYSASTKNKGGFAPEQVRRLDFDAAVTNLKK
ncbi:MAG TPA: DUF4157 domain-containing protein [Bacteroidia bacterium]|nr:DUF4157 domain-containing protein [Bacteroidia bacterium]